MTRVAMLGLGSMGRRMAQRLLAAGHHVQVWNRSAGPAEELRAAGASVARRPRDAAAEAEVIISMVTDDEASRAVWMDQSQGALHGLGSECVAIEMSTLTPGWCRELAQRVTNQGAAFLDVPVVGSRPQAEAGQLVCLVGGPSDALSRVSDVLNTFAGAVHHVGDHGAGASLKLVVNALFGIQVAALGELLALARRVNLDPARTVEILGSLAVTSPAAKVAATHIQSERFDPLFPIVLVEKDFRYVLALAEAHGAATPITRQTHDCFSLATSRGSSQENITAVSRIFLTRKRAL